MNKQPELDGSKRAREIRSLLVMTAVILFTEDPLLLLVVFTHNNVLNDT